MNGLAALFLHRHVLVPLVEPFDTGLAPHSIVFVLYVFHYAVLVKDGIGLVLLRVNLHAIQLGFHLSFTDLFVGHQVLFVQPGQVQRQSIVSLLHVFFRGYEVTEGFLLADAKDPEVVLFEGNIRDFDGLQKTVSMITGHSVIRLVVHVNHKFFGVLNKVFGYSAQSSYGDHSAEFLLVEIVDVHVGQNEVPFLLPVVLVPLHHL